MRRTVVAEAKDRIYFGSRADNSAPLRRERYTPFLNRF